MDFVDVEMTRKRAKVKQYSRKPKGRDVSTLGRKLQDHSDKLRSWAALSEKRAERIGRTEPSFED